MKAAVFKLLSLLVAVLCINGCSSGNVRKSLAIDFDGMHPGFRYDEQYAEHQYDSYTLGEDIGQKYYSWTSNEHKQTGTVYQIVYENRYKETGKGMAMHQRCVYRYEEFPFSTGENQNTETVWFRGKYSVWVFNDMGGGTYAPTQERLAQVTDPGAYGLLEDYVFSLNYEIGHFSPEESNPGAYFLVRERRNAETVYVVYRDGTVTRDGIYVAEEKLSDQVTAAVFALKYVHGYATKTYLTYPVTRIPVSGENPVLIQVCRMGQVWILTEQEARDFLHLVSDNPDSQDATDSGDHPLEREFGFLSDMFCNTNEGSCGNVELSFTVVKTYADGRIYDEREYLLYSDGRIFRDLGHPYEYNASLGETVIDQLVIDRYAVSKTRFDVPAIVSFLNSQSEAGIA